MEEEDFVIQLFCGHLGLKSARYIPRNFSHPFLPPAVPISWSISVGGFFWGEEARLRMFEVTCFIVAALQALRLGRSRMHFRLLKGVGVGQQVLLVGC